MASIKQHTAKTRVVVKPTISRRRAAPVKAEPPKPVIVVAQPREPSTAMLERGIDLLERLAKDGPIGVAELAKQTTCAPATATRLLRILQTKGFAVCDEANKTWRLGTR